MQQESIIEIFKTKIDHGNPLVRDKVRELLISRAPGALNIEQICIIYEYLRDGWIYVADPRGAEYYSPASETLQYAESMGCSGFGDNSDFAILISALIEALGGTTRIVLAYDESVGHAYTEVYLGHIDQDKIEDIIFWLKQRYNVDEIYTHVDSETKEVWLNLDCGEYIEKDSYPGGKLFERTKHVIVSISEEYESMSVRPIAR